MLTNMGEARVLIKGKEERGFFALAGQWKRSEGEASALGEEGDVEKVKMVTALRETVEFVPVLCVLPDEAGWQHTTSKSGNHTYA